MPPITFHHHHILKGLLAMSVILLTSACGGGMFKPDAQIEFRAGSSLNRDAEGLAHPVVIRICQLRDKDRFETATFEELLNQETDFLGNDDVIHQEFTLFPDSKQIIEIDIAHEEDAQYLGVMALFHKPGPDTWRVVIPLEHDHLWRKLLFQTIHKALAIDNDRIQIRRPT